MNTFVGTCVEKIFELTQAIGFPSYALAIVIITIIIKLILFPLNQKQIKSTKNIQVIQPKVNELNQKYADNPQKKSEELMKLYRENNINPMAGCLPLLIQMPIIIILYQGLLHFEPAHPELYTLFGTINLGSAPESLLIPVIVALGTFLQSFTSMGLPKESMQKSMLIMMPLMIGYMSTKFQVFICLYWFTFSILGVIQQIIVNRGLTPQSGAARKEKLAAANEATIDVKPVKEPAKGAEKGVKNVNTSKKKKK
ncbi:MAG: YidC/Oxa1 family membrane protein insertase [Bacillota bacterium]